MRRFVSESGQEYSFDPAAVIGEPGTYGTVFKGIAPDGSPVAVKRVTIRTTSTRRRLDDTTQAEREVSIATALSAQPQGNLVPLLAVSRQDGELLLVMPLASQSLADLISANGPLDDNLASNIVLDCAKGMQELAALSVVHRDIKPSNILEVSGKWCLADFGISRVSTEATSPLTFAGGGTSEYRAPELWNGERERVASDLYALGCVAYEMVTGEKAFPGPEFRDQHLTTAPEIPSSVDPGLRTLIGNLLAKEPSSRPPDARSVVEILSATNALTDGQIGLQKIKANSVAAKLQRDANLAAIREYKERQRQGVLSFEALWKAIADQARQADSESSAIVDRSGIYFLTVGDARLQIELESPTTTHRELLFVCEVVVRVEGYPGSMTPANLVCVWQEGIARWFVYRFPPQHNKSITGLGINPRDFESRWNLFHGDGGDATPTVKETASAENIIQVFVEAVGFNS